MIAIAREVLHNSPRAGKPGISFLPSPWTWNLLRLGSRQPHQHMGPWSEKSEGWLRMLWHSSAKRESQRYLVTEVFKALSAERQRQQWKYIWLLLTEILSKRANLYSFFQNCIWDLLPITGGRVDILLSGPNNLFSPWQGTHSPKAPPGHELKREPHHSHPTFNTPQARASVCTKLAGRMNGNLRHNTQGQHLSWTLDLYLEPLPTPHRGYPIVTG